MWPGLTSSAGKVAGTRITCTLRPARAAISHIVRPWRWFWTLGTSTGSQRRAGAWATAPAASATARAAATRSPARIRRASEAKSPSTSVTANTATAAQRAFHSPTQKRAPSFADHGEVRQIRLRIAPQEVEDLGRTRRRAGGERRPGDRRLRRVRRQQRRVAAVGAELRQVGQLARGHVLLDEPGIRAVEPEHDDLRARPAPTRLRSPARARARAARRG